MPLIKLRFRCSNCGSNRTDSSDKSPLLLAASAHCDRAPGSSQQSAMRKGHGMKDRDTSLWELSYPPEATPALIGHTDYVGLGLHVVVLVTALIVTGIIQNSSCLYHEKASRQECEYRPRNIE